MTRKMMARVNMHEASSGETDGAEEGMWKEEEGGNGRRCANVEGVARGTGRGSG